MADQLFKKNERLTRVPIYLRLLVLFPALVLPIYWIVTDTGLWRAISIFQAERLFDGGHYIVLTGALCFLVTVTAALLIVFLLSFLFKGEKS